jgi:hypothetical protein
MLVKTGDAEIIGIVEPAEIEDDDVRGTVLATALDKAKAKLSAKESSKDKSAMEN